MEVNFCRACGMKTLGTYWATEWSIIFLIDSDDSTILLEGFSKSVRSTSNKHVQGSIKTSLSRCLIHTYLLLLTLMELLQTYAELVILNRLFAHFHSIYTCITWVPVFIGDGKQVWRNWEKNCYFWRGKS